MSMMTRKQFLKFGAALPLALQSLRAGTASKPAGSSPKRVLFICNSLGFYAPYFFPKERGDLSTSDYLRDLAVPEKASVFQGLWHPGMETSNHDSEKSFLTGTPKPESQTFVNDESLDQVLAKRLGGETRFPFLNFSIYDRGWGCSWNDRGTAIPPMHDEEQIFEMLFGEEDLTAKKRRLRDDQHVLACLKRDLDRLRRSGGSIDKITSYEGVVGEMEAQLRHETFWLETAKPKVEKSLNEDREFGFSTKIANLFELAKLAFRTDSTRIMTFSMDWIYGSIKVPGAEGGWHTLSHHGGKKDMIARLSRIEVDIMKHFNRFLADLEAIDEGDGTLLDHTTVVMGSNFGDASNHTCRNLPTIVVGGSHEHRGHVALGERTPLCSLWLELLHKHDLGIDRFGSSEGDLGLLG